MHNTIIFLRFNFSSNLPKHMFTSTQLSVYISKHLLLSMLNTTISLIQQYTFSAIYGAFHASHNHTHLFFLHFFFKENILLSPTTVSDILLDNNCNFQKKQNCPFLNWDYYKISMLSMSISVKNILKLLAQATLINFYAHTIGKTLLFFQNAHCLHYLNMQSIKYMQRFLVHPVEVPPSIHLNFLQKPFPLSIPISPYHYFHTISTGISINPNSNSRCT